MKSYKTNEIKNIALLGSKGSGKTTLAESMLYECGVIKRRGTIEAGNTVCDYFPVEKEYGYSVFSTVFYAEFLNKKLNVIDCPGSEDFVGNAYTALGVTDTGVIVVDSQYGVEVGTQNIFRTTATLKKPVIFALNQLDGEKADYENVMEQMRETFGPKVIAIQYPLESGPGFHSMIDVLLMKKYEWGPEGGVPTITEIPDDQMEKAKELHNALVEAAAENDETLMDKYFEQGKLTEDEMRAGIRKGLVDRSIFPVFCVSAQKDMGVRRMMEFLGNVCPFVNDMPDAETTQCEVVKADSNGPVSLFVFKTSVEPHIGEVSYFRVMSGTLKAGADLENISRGSKERFAQIFSVCGQIRTAVDTLEAGDIGAAVGLKSTTTGDTLCDEKHPVILESMNFPEPVIRVAIEPKTKAGQEKMGLSLAKLAEEDPTFKAYTDEETGQTIIAGMGELHLEIIVDRLLREFKVEANVGAPQVAYKESIRKKVDHETKYKRQSGGSGQYGHVKIIVEPNESGKGYEFINSVTGGTIPKEFIPAVDAGVKGALQAGVLANYPVVDVKVTLYDGSYHEVDSSEMAFKIAGSMAFKEACRLADPVLLEPIMKVTVIVPEEYMGDVIGDLNSRRGEIQGFEDRAGVKQINARVPLGDMFGYATDLRSKTQGRGQYVMEPDGYKEVPKSISEKIISARAKKD